MDSITVQFIVLGNGKLTGLESVSPEKPNHTDILRAIKQHSCVWSVVGGSLNCSGEKWCCFTVPIKKEIFNRWIRLNTVIMNNNLDQEAMSPRIGGVVLLLLTSDKTAQASRYLEACAVFKLIMFPIN